MQNRPIGLIVTVLFFLLVLGTIVDDLDNPRSPTFEAPVLAEKEAPSDPEPVSTGNRSRRFSVPLNPNKDADLLDYWKTKGELTEEEQVELADLEGQEAEWTISNRVDQMSDVSSWYARSPLALSHGIESFISFVCSGKYREVYIGFDRQVRIRWNNGFLGTKKLRAKWSGRSNPEEAYFEENGRFIHFVKVEETMKHLVEWKRKELKLEVPLVPEGNAIFRYDLSGAARGIAKAREKCRS